MKTPASAQPIHTLLAGRAALLADIPATQKIGDQAAAELADLEANCDLNDVGALEKIARLQTKVDLCPRRIAAKEAAVAQHDAKIIAAVNTFAERDLNPRTHRLEQLAREKARQALRPHFPQADLLERHVGQSALVMELSGNTVSRTDNPFHGPEVYAQTAIKLWTRLDEIEAKLAA